MKKFFSLILLLGLTIVLTSCGEKGGELSKKEINEKIEAYLDAKSFETSLHMRIVTEEMEVKVNPLLTVSKYTNKDNKVITKVHYHNKIMEGLGIDAFQFIYDEIDEKVYLNTTEAWYQGSIDQVGEIFDTPAISADAQKEIDFVKDTLVNAIKNYKAANFVEVVNEDDRVLVHYELEYNIFDVAKEIFDHFNKGRKLGYDDFSEFMRGNKIDDLIDLFRTFKIDVYFDAKEKNQLTRIELELMHIFNNKIVTNKIQKMIKDNDRNTKVDFSILAEYVKHFEIGLNINKVNKLEGIEIPSEAKAGHDIKLLNAPFDINKVTKVNLGYAFGVDFSKTYGEQWYSFTVPQNQQINITGQTISYLRMYLYDSDYKMINLTYNYSNGYMATLKPGTYYISFYAYSGSYIVTIQ